jgi:NitT/TauT family transport system substrate-binding protein
MSVKAISNLFRKLDLALIVPKDSPIKDPSDVKGKRLIFTAGGFEGPFIEPFLEKVGLNASQVKLMNVTVSARNSTYVNGGADGLFGGAIGDYSAVNSKLASNRILFPDVGINVPSFGYVVTPTILLAKGDALRKFVSIAAGAWGYTLAGHEQEAAEAVARANPQSRLDPVVTLEQVKLSLPFLYTPNTKDLPLGVQSEADWLAGIEVLEKTKMIKPGSKPSDYYTNDYIDVALVKKIESGEGP